MTMIRAASKRIASLGESGLLFTLGQKRGGVLKLRSSVGTSSRMNCSVSVVTSTGSTSSTASSSSSRRMFASCSDDSSSNYNSLSSPYFEASSGEWDDLYHLRHPQPMPALALAPDYIDDEEYYSNHEEYYLSEDSFRRKKLLDSTLLDSSAVRSSAAGGGGGSSTSNNNNSNSSSSRPYPPPTEYDTTTSKGGVQTRAKLGGGGGGGGGSGGGGPRCRCPKCGTYVTFRHGEFEANTFYCAACSGWFVMSPTAMQAVQQQDDGSGVSFDQHATALLDKSIHRKKLDEPQVIMRHFPEHDNNNGNTNNPKVFTGRSRAEILEEARKTLEQQAEAEAQAAQGLANAHSTGGTEIKKMPTPRQIMGKLNEYVIGQRNVKVALSVGVYNHYKRIFVAETQAMAAASASSGSTASSSSATHRASDVDEGFIPVNTDGMAHLNLGQFGSATVSNDSPAANSKDFCETPDINSIADANFGRDIEDCEIDKSNILLLGPTGSGKTLLVRTLARVIDVPLVIADATCLTQAGYVGEDVESILFKLYLESGQDIERCQRGIVYLDECDKIRRSGGNVSISRDVSGEGVQHALLKIVEGNVINVPKEPGRKNPRGDFLQIDTTNILFICGGAFSGLERIINRRMDAASIGFGAQMKKSVDDPKVQGMYFDNAIPKDLVDYGMIPEFVGRFPVIVSTKGLDIQNLVDILTVPKNSIIKQYKRLFAMDDVHFHVTEEALQEIAKTAFSRGTGARGLRSITDNVLMETQYVVPSIPDVHTVYVDAPAVRGERKPILFKNPEMTVEKYEHLLQEGDPVVDGAVLVNIEDEPEIEEAAA